MRGQGRRDETEQGAEKGREIQRQKLRDGDKERQEMQGGPKPWRSAKKIQRGREGGKRVGGTRTQKDKTDRGEESDR